MWSDSDGSLYFGNSVYFKSWLKFSILFLISSRINRTAFEFRSLSAMRTNAITSMYSLNLLHFQIVKTKHIKTRDALLLHIYQTKCNCNYCCCCLLLLLGCVWVWWVKWIVRFVHISFGAWLTIVSIVILQVD